MAGFPPQRRGPRLVGAVVRLVISVVGGFCDLGLAWGAALPSPSLLLSLFFSLLLPFFSFFFSLFLLSFVLFFFLSSFLPLFSFSFFIFY